MDYKKFVYEQKKRDKILKAKYTSTVKKFVLVLKQMSMIMNLKKERWKILKEGAKLKRLFSLKVVLL
jgi:translation initiation factor IF-3